eukprot:TRINITY_DN1130_c0_g1_i2.p1 TRINITY_DN1130_c0_g1~~TRINITY_DN1130_c0_g1_i2.p1  ORF type:complete len:143 (-),score=31.94 TRINITY_DN1130_c0_g1_i2:32-460(-)
MSTSYEDALWVAAKAGYLDDLQELLNVQVNFNQQDDFGNTPLHYACAGGHPGAVEILLGAPNVDINITNFQGDTPLHRAASKPSDGAGECVRILIAAGAETSIVNNDGAIAFNICVNSGKDICAPVLDSMFSTFSCFFLIRN